MIMKEGGRSHSRVVLCEKDKRVQRQRGETQRERERERERERGNEVL